jgi:hypothetical protein
MVFSVDGIEHYTYQPSVQNAATWPFTKDQYLLLNIAIEPSIASNFTSSAMEVDYVRVFQKNTANTPEENANFTFQAFPNPAQTAISIQTDETEIGSTLEVLDLQGRLIHEELVQSTVQKLDCSSWTPGVYFIRIAGISMQNTLKIVKE